MKRSPLILLVILLIFLPLLLPVTSETPFTGTDNQAQATIVATHPDYTPWFEPLWSPPSKEIESLLFTLQAALGAGLLGYYIGFKRGQAQNRQRDNSDAAD